jgi:iron complex transport system substrate-binding protein
VWFIPDLPLNWFDRPPSFMRFLGLQWLAHRLYPQRFSVDLHGESRRFYKQFLGVELDEAQLEMIAP